jgi:hypothetical protein
MCIRDSLEVADRIWHVEGGSIVPLAAPSVAALRPEVELTGSRSTS